jgi:hypothetical protein
MGLHPPVFGVFSKPSSGLDSMGNSGSDIQPWSPIHHRRCPSDFNFTQQLSEMRSGREIKPETVNVGR